MAPRPTDRLLVLLLRLGGVLTGCALFAVFLPERWMAASHSWLGLGDFPAAPITDYLTRSLSAMYAGHGAILLALSTDVERYRPVIRWLGGVTVGLGLVLLGVDLRAPMPLWWTLIEGPPVIVTGALITWLARRGTEDQSTR